MKLTCLALVFASACIVPLQAGTTVRFTTNVGNFDVALYDDEAPQTVANFLNYVSNGDYDASIVHRSIPNFVVQGGGYLTDFSPIPTNPPVVNEAGHSNLRGTIAMARTVDPNSATNQWFINLVDNPFLDTQSGGFTVFGEVISPGMATVDEIAALDTIYEAIPFEDLPLLDVLAGRDSSNLVVVQSVAIVPEPSTSVLALGLLFLANQHRRTRPRVPE